MCKVLHVGQNSKQGFITPILAASIIWLLINVVNRFLKGGVVYDQKSN